MSCLNLALLVVLKSLAKVNIRSEFGYQKTLVLSWLLDQQNRLGFVRQMGIFKHASLKLFWASDILSVTLLFFGICISCLETSDVGRLVEKQRILHSLCHEVSGGLSFLQNFQIAARSKVDLILLSVHFEKCHIFKLSLVHVFLNLEYFRRNQNLA